MSDKLKGRDEILERLNEIYAEETEAAIRYQHLAITLKGIERLTVRPVLMEAMEETLEHAQTIAEKIVQLGGAPKLSLNLELSPERVSAAEAIRTALAFEQACLDAYRELLDEVGDDVALREFLHAQVAEESKHVAELYLLLE